MTPEPISHDQLVSRVQAFYSHLRKDYDKLKVARDFPCDDLDQRREIAREFGRAEELIELYSHAFESVLYTWMD